LEKKILKKTVRRLAYNPILQQVKKNNTKNLYFPFQSGFGTVQITSAQGDHGGHGGHGSPLLGL
jgi:hypothetical protein